MTQLELKEHFRDKLIPHYKLAIERCMGKEYQEAMIVCDFMNVDFGICLCSVVHFGKSIYGNEIMNKGFWYDYPYRSSSTPEILDLLQKRVDKMESIVNS